MGYWLCMLVIVLIIPVLLIFFGQHFYKDGAPKKINTVFGYRTQRSIKTWDSWAYAHNQLGKIWRLTGLILIPVSAGIFALAFNKNVDEISIFTILVQALQIVAIIITILVVEGRLKKNFDDRGARTEESIAAENEAIEKKEKKKAEKAEKKSK
ncbi:MAG: SdpI family protein [Clostridia bacterium]|nr:SdpI family protein [Clostridia bacterium]